MNLPTLNVQNKTRKETIEVFGGFNHSDTVGPAEFFNMKNMTSDHYPLIASRGRRGKYAAPESPQGLIAKDALCYIDGASFVMNGYAVDMDLSTAEEDCPKQLISMGAYVIIMPDRKYINTLDLTDFGDIDAEFTSSSDVSFELCTADGNAYTDAIISDDEPDDPENLDLWMDTSSTPHSLKKYSASSGMWVPIATTYIKISTPGIGLPFDVNDGVQISGILDEKLQDLNAKMVIWAIGDDYIVVTGILDAVSTQTAEDGPITVERKMPLMDFITESENRLWGCRYGVADNGEVVNELYACKLGDFKNWNCFMGLSTDSYVVTCGTDGRFTGAVTHLGFPLFFKEGCLHKVYGNYPANFKVQTTTCRGVQRGCERSLAIVNEVLYYKARHAVCAYDGSLPVEVSAALGAEHYSNAVAGAHGNKYHISMMDAAGTYHLFVYDTVRGMWHREDHLHADCICSCKEDLYCIDHDSKEIITLLGSGVSAGSLASKSEKHIEWSVETGLIGMATPTMQYITEVLLKLSTDDPLCMVSIYIQYDSEAAWNLVTSNTIQTPGSALFPIRPHRCDHFRLKIEGNGAAKIFSITKKTKQGSSKARAWN